MNFAKADYDNINASCPMSSLKPSPMSYHLSCPTLDYVMSYVMPNVISVMICLVKYH